MSLSDAQLTDALAIAEGVIRYRALYSQVPGIAYGVSNAGKTVLLGSMGVADLATGKPVSPNTTSFRCASITKTFTATLVMQQVERGKLRLDDAAVTYLPWAKASLGMDVNLRQLLMHAGSVIRDGSNHWGDDDFPDRAALHREIREQGVFGEPLTTFRYSNVAYALLGEILEKVTGKTFAQLIDANIAKPLQMNSTAMTLPAAGDSLATGYYPRRPGESFRAARPTEARAIGPAGGLISTVPDLLSYQQAHFAGNGELLRDVSKREMQRVQWMRPEDRHHGLGWMIWNVGDIKLCGHVGGYPGFNTKIGFAPELGVAAAVLTNTHGPTQDVGITAIFDTLARVPQIWQAASEKSRWHSRADLRRLCGQYRGDWGELLVARVNNVLYLVDVDLETPMAYAARLKPTSARRFVIVEGDDYGHFGEEVSFRLDRSGRAAAMKYGPHLVMRDDI